MSEATHTTPIPSTQASPFEWSQEIPSMQVSGTLSAVDGIVGEPLMLALQVKHPSECVLHLSTPLSPLFLSSFRVELLHNIALSKQESMLTFAITPLHAGTQQFIQADLFCMAATQAERTNHTVLRMPLQLPVMHITDKLNPKLSPPLPLEPLPIALHGEALLLNDLHTPIQIPSWQHNAEILHEHGVPWGGITLIATGIICAYGIFSWIKHALRLRKQKPIAPRDAAEEVLLQLKALKARKLVETHHFADYYSGLVSLLRWYLHERFPIADSNNSNIPPEVKQLQEDLIAYADPVEFGRRSSTERDCELALAYVKHCVYLVEKERIEHIHSKKKKGEATWFQKWFKKP